MAKNQSYENFNDTFSGHRSSLKEDIRAAKQGIEQSIGLGKSVDELMKEAKKSINKSRDSVHGAVDSIKISGPSSQKRVDIIMFKKEISALAKTANQAIDDAKEIYLKKEKAIKDWTQYEVKDGAKWQTLDNKLFDYKLGNFNTYYFTLPDTDDVKAKTTAISKAKKTLAQGQSIYTTGQEFLAFSDTMIANLQNIKDNGPEDISVKADKELARITKSRDARKKELDEVYAVYNAGLKKLQSSIGSQVAREKGKIEEYRNKSGVAQMEMDKGKIKQEERVAAYTRYTDQKKLIPTLEAFAKEVDGYSPIPSGAPTNVG